MLLATSCCYVNSNTGKTRLATLPTWPRPIRPALYYPAVFFPTQLNAQTMNAGLINTIINIGISTA